ncbi:hypothetical protein SAMN04488048_11947 [Trichococcus flocculiformis]|jgi:hypothetical protein|nr:MULTISPECIES: hypothetical protein [Trichococcus]CZR08049.1 Hypothetical protein TES5_2501 [Trichococcus sp. ES5]SHF97283.1 hypothetical protein SAMN04488048_11947 [Trichococcus flocculiformis]
MRKIFMCVLMTLTLLNVAAPDLSVFADENDTQVIKTEITGGPNTTIINANIIPEETVHEYEYDGLVISSNIALEEDDFLRIQQEVTEASKTSKITVRGPVQPGTYTGSIIYGPVNRVNSNKSVQFVVDVFIAWVGTKIPVKYTDTTFKNYIVSSVLGWNIAPTYTSEWISRATYTPNTDFWQYFSTIVRHSSSSFNNPTHVTYYSTHIERK